MARRKYKGTKDAEMLLTKVLKRANFGYELRDNLATALERIVARELTPAAPKTQSMEQADGWA